MTRKDYEKAASLIREANWDNSVSNNERKRMAETFAKFFGGDNPRFDKVRFMEACNV